MKRAFLCAVLVAYATRSLGEVQVQTVRWKSCEAATPEGWTVSAETPLGTAFGADLKRLDGSATVSYLVFGVPPEVRPSAYYQQWYATPERAVIGQLTRFGANPATCNTPAELMAGSGYMEMSCESRAFKKVVAYRVFGRVESGYAVLMRTAGAPTNTWSRIREEATSVARSVQCQVPLLPSRMKLDIPEPPKKGNKGQDPRSAASPWFGTESYHDAKTGQNYWVSPTRDWDETGLEGPGYYIKIGNSARKLKPGLFLTISPDESSIPPSGK
jgi:hypothetical protein